QSLVLLQDQQLLELEEGEIKEAAEVGSNVMGAMGCCAALSPRIYFKLIVFVVVVVV
ncbi:unnamed protein product, partial [Polarella glacialis]